MLGWVPYLSIAVAVVLTYWPRHVAGQEMKQLPGGYDNHNPRDQQAQLSGVGRRALAAHQNGFEAFPIFAAGVLAAMQRNASLEAVSALCVIFVVVRTVFVTAYLSDKDGLRSGMFAVGFFASIGLYGLAIAG